MVAALLLLASNRSAWADICGPIHVTIDSGANDNNRVTGRIVGDQATLKIIPDGGSETSLGGKNPAGASGSITGTTTLEGNSYTITFTWSTVDDKLKCEISFKCNLAVGQTGSSYSTVQTTTGSPDTGMTVVVDAVFTRMSDLVPLDTTFSHADVVTLWRHSGQVDAGDYTVTILDSDSTSNGDGTSDWEVRYRIEIDPLNGNVHELYSNFHWWNEPPAEDHTFAGSSAILYTEVDE
jgi:hypothetical protein